MKITAEFVTSATVGARFLPEGAPAIALVGRSNVGKSSLVNALVRRRVARTSAAPGKTRLANLYRVERGAAAPLYLVDLPGYGYARGGANDFARLVGEFFAGAPAPVRNADQSGPHAIAALLLVDARHPGLESDVNAWRWLNRTLGTVAIVATKIDKLSRGRRIRALQQLESVFDDPVLPVSAVTGEGLDDLWKLIDRPTHRRKPPTPPSRSPRGAEPLHPSA